MQQMETTPFLEAPQNKEEEDKTPTTPISAVPNLEQTQQKQQQQDIKPTFIPSEYTKRLLKNKAKTPASEVAEYSEEDDDTGPVGYLEGMGIGVITSPTITKMRQTRYLTGAITGKQYIPQTDEELEEILNVTGYSEPAYKAALRGASTMDEVRKNLKRMEADQKLLNRVANSSWGVSVSSGLVGGLADPYVLGSLFIPMSGLSVGSRAVSFLGRSAINTATSMPLVLMSEYEKEYITGREADYWYAAGMTAAVSVGFASGAFLRSSAKANAKAKAKAGAKDTADKVIDVVEEATPMPDTLSPAMAKVNLPSDELARRVKQESKLLEQDKLLAEREATLTKKRDVAQQNLKKAEQQLSEATNKRVELDIAKRSAEDDLKVNKELSKMADEEVKIYQKAYDEIAVELHELNGKIEQVKNAIKSNTTKLKVAKDNRNAINSEVVAIPKKEKGRKASERYKIKQLERANARKGVKDIEDTLKELRKEKSNLFKNKAEINNRYNKAASALRTAKTQAKNISEDVKKSENKFNKTSKTLDKQLTVESDLQKAIRTNTRNSERFNKKLTKVTESRQKLANALKEAREKALPIDDAVISMNRVASTKVIKDHDEYLKAQQAQQEGTVGELSKAEAEATENIPSPDVVARTTGDEVANRVSDNPTFKEKLRNLLSNPTKVFELKAYLYSVLKDSNTPDSVKQLLNRLVHFEEGVKRGNGRYSQYASTKPTYMESVEGFKVRDNLYGDKLNTLDNILRRKYGDEIELVDNYIYRKIEGSDIPEELAKFEKDSKVQEALELYKKSFEERKAELVNRKILQEEAGTTLDGYAPLTLDLNKIHDFVRIHFPNNPTAATKFISSYLVKGIQNSPSHFEKMVRLYIKERKLNKLKPDEGYGVDEAIKTYKDTQGFQDWLIRKANKAAKGYIDQGRSLSKAAKDSLRKPIDDLYGGAEDFSFLKPRVPWNAGYVDKLGDTGSFSLNDLRVSAVEAHTKYRARSTGVLSDFDTFGKDYYGVQEMFEEQSRALQNAKNLDPSITGELADNLEMLHKRAYGMSVSATNEAFGYLDAASQILRNLAFSSFGTYMGLNSIGELGRALRATSFFNLLKLVPFAGRLFERWTSKGFTKADLDSIRGQLIGNSFRPILGYKSSTFRGMRRISNAKGNSKFRDFIGKVTGATDYIADRSPAGLLLRSINTRIDDVFENCALTDLAKRAYDNTASTNKGFMSDEALRELNISKEQFTNLLNVFKKYVTKEKGHFKVSDKLEEFVSQHPEELYTLRRLMKHVRETTMQRRNLDDIFMYERSSKNSILALALQFKAFSIQSFRKRFVKSIHQVEDGQGAAVFYQYLTSLGLTSMVTLGAVHLKSLGLEGEQRDRYFERALGIKDFSELSDPSKLTRFAYSITVNRMSELASISMGLNTFGIGTGTKTTASVGGGDNDGWFLTSTDVGRTVTDMFPSLRIGQSLVSGVTATYNAGLSASGVKMSRADEKTQGKLLLDTISGLPNIPYLSAWAKGEVKDSYDLY